MREGRKERREGWKEVRREGWKGARRKGWKQGKKGKREERNTNNKVQT